jgi:hypothetical protein
VQVDDELLTEAQTVKSWKLPSGGIGITIGTNTLVAAVTAGLTWFASHKDSAPIDCASKADVSDVRKEVSEVKSGLAAFAEKYSNDASVSHNDTELLKLRIQVLSDRLVAK